MNAEGRQDYIKRGLRYYVGDPCYVIDDDRWWVKDDPTCFCSMLWKAAEEQGGLDGEGITLKWPLQDGTTVKIQVCNSPGGDGTWDFPTLTDDMGQKVSLGVDAGLLAIVPIEACERSDDSVSGGSLWSNKPTLEVDENGYEVFLNGEGDASKEECGECGGRCDESDMEAQCDGDMVCWSCFDCDECSRCGWCITHDECTCEACWECGDKAGDIHEKDGYSYCDDCLEDEEE